MMIELFVLKRNAVNGTIFHWINNGDGFRVSRVEGENRDFRFFSFEESSEMSFL